MYVYIHILYMYVYSSFPFSLSLPLPFPSLSPSLPHSQSKMSISPKIRSGGNSIKKKSSPHTTAGTPSPHNTKVFYDYTHSPSTKITAISLSPSISSSHGAREPVGGAVGGVSPRKKFSGLFKAQKPKI